MVRESKDRVLLLDFSPYGPAYSAPLAFGWSELDEVLEDRRDAADDDPELRFVSENTGIQPSARMTDGIPRDVVDFYQSGAAEASPQSGGQATLDDLLFRQLRGLGRSE